MMLACCPRVVRRYPRTERWEDMRARVCSSSVGTAGVVCDCSGFVPANVVVAAGWENGGADEDDLRD